MDNTVEVKIFSTGPEIREALEAGEIDFGTLDAQPAILANNNGTPFICGVPIGHGNVDLDSIIKKLCHKTQLSHLILEMCFPYANTFSRFPESMPNLLNQKTFQLSDFPYVDPNYPLENYYTYNGKHLEELIVIQKQSVEESTRTLKHLLKQYDNPTISL